MKGKVYHRKTCRECTNAKERESYDPELRRKRYRSLRGNASGNLPKDPMGNGRKLSAQDFERKLRYQRDAALFESWAADGFVSGREVL